MSATTTTTVGRVASPNITRRARAVLAVAAIVAVAGVAALIDSSAGSTTGVSAPSPSTGERSSLTEPRPEINQAAAAAAFHHRLGTTPASDAGAEAPTQEAVRLDPEQAAERFHHR